jgi:hypothetical protein
MENFYWQCWIHSVPVRIYINHCCLNVTLFRWAPCPVIHPCCCCGMDGITFCSIRLATSWINSRILCFKSRIWQDVFRISCFWRRTKGSRSLLQDRAVGRGRWWRRKEKWFGVETLSWYLACNKLCCVGSCYMTTVSMVALLSGLAGWVSGFTHRPVFIDAPVQFAHLFFQCQNTALWLRQKQGTRDTPCQYSWVKTANWKSHSRAS